MSVQATKLMNKLELRSYEIANNILCLHNKNGVFSFDELMYFFETLMTINGKSIAENISLKDKNILINIILLYATNGDKDLRKQNIIKDIRIEYLKKKSSLKQDIEAPEFNLAKSIVDNLPTKNIEIGIAEGVQELSTKNAEMLNQILMEDFVVIVNDILIDVRKRVSMDNRIQEHSIPSEINSKIFRQELGSQILKVINDQTSGSNGKINLNLFSKKVIDGVVAHTLDGLIMKKSKKMDAMAQELRERERALHEREIEIEKKNLKLIDFYMMWYLLKKH